MMSMPSLPGFFFASDPNLAQNQQLRQRLAMAMMANRSRFPKTLGEGLGAIGEAIGDRGMMDRILSDDAASLKAAQEIAAQAPGGVVPPPIAPAPPSPPRAQASPTEAAPVAGLPPDESVPVPPVAAAAAPTATSGGFRPAPAYLAAALQERIQDPARRGLLGHLAGKEAQSPDETSSTGAAGPFQFTRGTGRQYGLIGPEGDKRRDIIASIDAANRLTDDNIKVLKERLGRDPTPGEIALAHQQGAVTASRMLLGTGNASARNLSVNNVAPGTSPQAAAQKIMAYYGMPSSFAPAPPAGPPDVAQDERLAEVTGMAGPTSGLSAPSAAAPVGRAGDVEQPPPELTGTSPALAASVADTAMQRRDAIAKAAMPPVPAPPVGPIASDAPPPTLMPGVQLAQAAGAAPPAPPPAPPPPRPGAEYGYIAPEPGRTAPPAPAPMSEREAWAVDQLRKNPNNPYVAQQLAPLLQQEQTRRTMIDAQNKVRYEADLRVEEQRRLKRDEQIATEAKRRVEGLTAEEELRQKQQPKPVELKGKYIYDEKTGTYREPQITGTNPDAPPNVELTKEQGNMLTFHGWAAGGNKGITGNDKLLAEGLAQELAGKIPFVGNAVQSAEYRRARNAANNFVLAFMRDTSGAAYGAKEMYDHASAFLPKYGDDPQTLADKAAARARYTDSLYAGMGSDARKASAWADKQQEKAATKLDIEMEGVPREVGKVVRNRKTGVSRIWTGKHWEDVQ